MTVLIIVAVVFSVGMIIMIFDSFNLFRIFKRSPVHVNATRETQIFFRSGKK